MDSAQFLLTSDKFRYTYSDAGSIFDMVWPDQHWSDDCDVFIS